MHIFLLDMGGDIMFLYCYEEILVQDCGLFYQSENHYPLQGYINVLDYQYLFKK